MSYCREAMQHALRLTAVVAALITAAALAGSARASCDPLRSHISGYWHDGWQRDISTIPGGTLGDVYAQIYEASPFVWSGVQVPTSAWVMIYNNSSPGQWVQIGWLKDSGGTRHLFDQWTDINNVSHQTLSPAQPAGNYTGYEVYWNPGTQRLEAYAAGFLFDSHPRYFTMRVAENYGEIHDFGSQMPGARNFHESFSQATVSNLSGNVYTFSGDVYSTDSTYFANANGGGQREDIWDVACAS